ncbi:hypothetical protein [Hymenobacter crusticola]|uniref:Lipocalin-like domain-containing protein n=1 Tax=Hymenobacter crusticola TaxID=1770526 RepID=A0A243W8T4_9BACT|nr:hypothetical protein [Hymenobacter crusticola]OUJ71428.1 hypothetical protein BXP70_21980 [Hymenobacter crusticola]
MKTFATSVLSLLLLALCVSTQATAQAQPPTATLPGYWNVEANRCTQKYAIVRFYNGQHELVHETRLANQHLVLNRRRMGSRTVQQLNVALQEVLRKAQANINTAVVPSQPH